MTTPSPSDLLGDEEQQTLVFKCSSVFRPTAPLDSRDLFAGRAEQIAQAGRAVHTIGQHAMIFGQRGVGKSSLANILKLLLSGERFLVVKVNCHKEQTFVGVWTSALSEIKIVDAKIIGLQQTPVDDAVSPAEWLPTDAGPDDIRRILQRLGKYTTEGTVFIFDEFDRLHGSKTQEVFADLIKNLSDNTVNVTLIIVGVANDVSQLIREHASIDRSSVQIHMPRMKPEELREIIQKGISELKMNIVADALNLIVSLSQGLPHFTHLIGQESAIRALQERRRRIESEDVRFGVNIALQKTQHSILEEYQNATRGQRKGTLFQQVLLACALAEVDEQGFFVSSAVREPLSKIMHKQYEIPGFSQHLDKFSSDPTRGPVFEKAGTSRRFRFRFINPLLQPYVIMRGLSDAMLEGDLLALLRAKRQPAY
jgi:Cdc6-like AAA superfamily ATPase